MTRGDAQVVIIVLLVIVAVVLVGKLLSR